MPAYTNKCGLLTVATSHKLGTPKYQQTYEYQKL
jgi:hypothetical protein